MYTKTNNYEEIIFRKKPKYIQIWLGIILLSLVFFCIIACFYQYNKFYKVEGLVIKLENDTYVQVLVENEKLEMIKNGSLMVNHKYTEFCYEISSNFYTDSGKVYREIKVFVENDHADNEIVTLLFVSPKTTLLKEIQEKIRKEM